MAFWKRNWLAVLLAIAFFGTGIAWFIMALRHG